jgi:predicted thioesterase
VGHAELLRTEGRRLHFRIWATDGAEDIGTGTHERAVVTVSRIVENMTAKYGAGSTATAGKRTPPPAIS